VRARALEETRRRFGEETPRTFEAASSQHHRLQPPTWCAPGSGDALAAIYLQQDALFREGRVVWGVLVQANSMLWEPGCEPCPALAIYGLQPEVDDELWTLKEIARALFALKGTIPSDPQQRSFAEMITDEMERGMKRAIPPSLTQGYELFSTSVMVHPHHLPSGHLASNVLPLLAHPDREPTVVLPSRYWSERILFEWNEPVGPAD